MNARRVPSGERETARKRFRSPSAKRRRAAPPGKACANPELIISLDVIDEVAVFREGDAVIVLRGGRDDLRVAGGRHLPEPETLQPGVALDVRDVFPVGRDSRVRRPARSRQRLKLRRGQ